MQFLNIILGFQLAKQIRKYYGSQPDKFTLISRLKHFSFQQLFLNLKCMEKYYDFSKISKYPKEQLKISRSKEHYFCSILSDLMPIVFLNFHVAISSLLVSKKYAKGMLKGCMS